MKNLLTAAFVAISMMACSITASGQQATDASTKAGVTPVKNELSLSYGIITTQDMINTLGAVLGAAFTFGQAAPDQLNCLGSINLGYYRWLKPRFAVGVESSLEFIRLTFKYANGKDDAGNTLYTSENGTFDTYASVMPAMKGLWLNREHCGIYSKIALGAMMRYHPAVDSVDDNGNEVHDPSTTDFYFAGQITPFGIDFGSPYLRGFVEVGFGTQGILHGGLRYRF